MNKQELSTLCESKGYRLVDGQNEDANSLYEIVEDLKVVQTFATEAEVIAWLEEQEDVEGNDPGPYGDMRPENLVAIREAGFTVQTYKPVRLRGDVDEKPWHFSIHDEQGHMLASGDSKKVYLFMTMNGIPIVS